ncbi:MAG: CpXC domain-containing protein [Solobacterium sp.]|nr:CpXC domain-containing protein [Solobacterium sp.]
MSNSRIVEYQCPYCGTKFETEIYDSVTADEDEDLRDRCVSGDLFRTSCPHCKQDFMIQFPLVYIDRRNRFVLWLSETEPGEELVRQIAGPLAPAGYTLRRTPTLKEFTEKIQIFEDGADDRAVELAKYDSLIEFIDNKKGTAEDVTSIDYQKTENGVMKINVRTGDKGMSFLIPVSMLEEEMEQNPERYRVDDASFPVINAEWMIQLFESLEAEGMLS